MSDHGLYREHVLEHYRNPQNYHEIDDADITGERSNPACGDRIMFFADCDDGKITDTSFKGEGCAICIAAASLLTEEVKELPLDEAEQLGLTDVEELLGVEISPSREQCATLALEALQNGIADYSGS